MAFPFGSTMVYGVAAYFGAVAALFHRRLRERPSRIAVRDRHLETEIGGLFGPGFSELALVDVALVGARHQRRAPGEMLVLRRATEAPGFHRRLDLGPARRERLYNVS